MPERLSVPVKLTVTVVLFQPAALGWGEAEAWAVGAVLSILTEGEVNVAVFPATSVTVTLPFMVVPSLLNDNGLGIEVEATPDSASTTVNGTETFVLFHPAAFAAGL